MDVKIGEYHMCDFGLNLLSLELGSPEVCVQKQEIPGRNGALDLTEALTGYPVYGNAKHVLVFDMKDGNYASWLAKASDLKGKIHGRRLPVVLGNDLFYYDARIQVDTEKLNADYSRISIELDAQPYKLALQSSLDGWLWDSFCFEEDVIREYTDIQMPAELMVIGGVMPAGCLFHVINEQGAAVEYEGKRYVFPETENGRKTTVAIPDILIMEGEHVMKFSGRGTVSVEYREGRF